MELEFNREYIESYDILSEMTLCQEETLESIVPDACPDILRIVDVCGQALLTGKQAHEGLACVNGVVRAAILYQPEGGGALRKMDVNLPFTCQTEAVGLTETGFIHASPRLRFAEARVLNPRKVLLRVDLAVDVIAFCQKEEKIVTSAQQEQHEVLCQLQYEGEHYYVSYVQEKTFTLKEGLRMQNTQPELSMLTSRAQVACTECRLIGSKLIFKGNADISLLFQEPGGMLSSEKENLPFSQILEIPGAQEGSDCSVMLEISDFQCRPSDEDGHMMDVTLELLAQVKVYTKRQITCLRDLYSTSHVVEVEFETKKLNQFRENTVRSQPVRDLVETQEMVRSVVDSRVTLGKISILADGNDLNLTADVCLTVLYLDESEQIRCVRKNVDVSCRVNIPKEMLYTCGCHVPGEVYSNPAAGGVEVRFSVDFQCCSTVPTEISTVNCARLLTSRSESREKVPSVVLRIAQPGESLWELAKTYGTTTQLILQANNLEPDTVPQGQMLLIPGCR